MTAKATEHLADNLILQAIVDPSDLSDPQQTHLAACPVCGAEKKRLEEMLLRLGNMAEASVPAVTGRPVLPESRPAWLQGRFFEIRSLARIAVPALVVLIVMTAVFVLNPGRDMHRASVDVRVMDPEQLLSDMDRLIENPLPQELQVMVSFAEIDPDDDFMDYIVPITENDPLSGLPGVKGENIC